MEIAKQATKEVDIDTLQSLCGKCGLYKDCKTPKMQVSGQGKKGILLVSDRLSYADDEDGTQFAGDSGKILHDALIRQGIHMFRDCWRTSAIRCASEKVQDPDTNINSIASD